MAGGSMDWRQRPYFRVDGPFIRQQLSARPCGWWEIKMSKTVGSQGAHQLGGYWDVLSEMMTWRTPKRKE